jgi:dipeptidyl aminopeptidase/acylaminoacyl peptidase
MMHNFEKRILGVHRVKPRYWLSITVALFSLPLAGSAQQALSPAPRAITVGDSFEIRKTVDPQLSPDAQWVAYTVKTLSLKRDRSEERIWMVPSSGGNAIPMSADDVSSSQPRWSPDGKYLAFLSARNEGKTQVWLLNCRGGEAERLTDTRQNVNDFVWSPDGQRLVLVLRDLTSEESEAAKEEEGEGRGSGTKTESEKRHKAQRPWVIDRLQFKEDGVGYLDRRRTHLYVFDIAAKSLTQVTSGDFDDSEPAWSPDGKQLAFTSNRSVPDPDRNYNRDIWTVAADNSDKGARLMQITANPGDDNSPSWSPDGKWIAYITQIEPRLFQYATAHVAISPSTGGQAKVLTLAFDRMSYVPRFSADGKCVYFIADDDGAQNLYRVAATGGEVTRHIAGRFVLDGYSLAKTGEIAAQISTADRPYEIHVLPASGGSLTRITHTNDALLSQLKLVEPEYVRFQSKDGTTVAGYVYKPLEYVPGKRYPTILWLHGGPVGAHHAEFSNLVQVFAATGYVVLLPNPRGSSGYGQHFSEAIFADWGNKDYQDDMAIVDYSIQQGIADSDKLGVGGWSYGAISTDFIIGQTTRFKAAISGAGYALSTSLYGHDQYQKDYETELGRPWENHDLWNKLSPFYKVAKITTPTLFMGGNIDWNVPILGSEQMYQALRSLGRTTELVVYPDENHSFKTPSHIKDRLERFLAWYGQYVKGDSTPATPPPPEPKSGE